MSRREPTVPRSCDAADLTDPVPSWLVWLVDDRGEIIVRSAPTFAGVLESTRAYRAAWGGQVLGFEDPAGALVPTGQWTSQLGTTEPLPYVYTVEMRSPTLNGREHVSALWTTTDLDSALRHRIRLPLTCAGGP